MDLTGFIVALLALITNPLGIVDGLGDIFEAARAYGDEGQYRLRAFLGRHLARPMRNFTIGCGIALVAVVLLVGFLYFKYVGFGWSFIGLLAYAAATVRMASLAVVVSQVEVARAETDAQNVRYVRVGVSLIAAIAVSSIALSLLALGTESRSLWLVSMLVRYAGISVIAAIAIVLSWIVRKGVGFFEKALQFIVEPLAALAPGITLKNVSAKLFGADGRLNILDEDFIGDKITAAASMLLVLFIPFDVLMYLYPTWLAAAVVGSFYLVSIITGYLARKIGGKADVVQESAERFALFLFTWAKWVAAVVVIGWGGFVALVPEHLRAAFDIQSWIASLWIARFISGDVGIGGGFDRWPAVGYVPLAVIIGYVVYHFTEELKDGWKGKVKAGLRIVASLLVLHSLVAFGVAFKIWGDPVKGITLQSSAVQPKVEAQEVALQSVDASDDAPTAVPHENFIDLSWTTQAPSDCIVEVISVWYRGLQAEHALLRDGTKPHAIADTSGKTHRFALNDLAIGMTVVFRIHATGMEGTQKGITTVTRLFNVSTAMTESRAWAILRGIVARSRQFVAAMDSSKPNTTDVSEKQARTRPQPAKPKERLASVDEQDKNRQRFDALAERLLQ